MVVELFERECGYQFDAQFTRLLLKHLPEFVAIRDTYPDIAAFEYSFRIEDKSKVEEEAAVS
ncbi:MAG: hypothetical protein VX212_08285 [Pseudomonadota bacterium]|nr:hypothetical protein [Pseudomonadota bacterium]